MNASAILTRREYEVAELLAWGGTKKQVAQHCHMAIRTAENTARNIYVKTGVTKVNELSAWWFCTHYSISFELSPLLRRTLAVFMLLLFCSLFAAPDKMQMRSRRAENCRASSGRRSREDDTYTIEL